MQNDPQNFIFNIRREIVYIMAPLSRHVVLHVFALKPNIEIKSGLNSVWLTFLYPCEYINYDQIKCMEKSQNSGLPLNLILKLLEMGFV